MKEDNKKFIDSSDFALRVLRVMEVKNISIRQLHERIVQIGYDITLNNLGIYLQRVPSSNFVVALSKALCISTDYLLGLEDIDSISNTFDYSYENKRYQKYIGDYFFYFFPTVSNTPQKLVVAKMSIIKAGNTLHAYLNVTTDEGCPKLYHGDILLSNIFQVGYACLYGSSIGEIVYLSFCDPVINGDMNINILLGLMISVSSGTVAKRVPVTSRFFVSRSEIQDNDLDLVRAQLMLNSKFICISSDSIDQAITSSLPENVDRTKFLARIKSAFEPKSFFLIDENYIINTLASDFKLSNDTIDYLISSLRNASFTSINNKINPSNESRLFRFLNKKNDLSPF